jgi:hypothetical protein
LVEPDVREIDRQKGGLGSPLERFRERQVLICDAVRFAGIGDVLAEEVNRARELHRG